MRKTFLLIVALAIPFIYFCCESSSDMENMQQKSENSTLVTAAKKFLTGLNCDLSLPAQQKGASTRSLDYPTDATPVWEDARTEQNGDEQIVIVPLLGKEEIRSKAVITINEEKSYQFAKAFSRLIIRTKGVQTIAHVLTYLPESEYAEAYTTELSTIGSNVESVNYQGIIMVSALNGNILHTLIYKEGHMIGKMLPAEEHSHTETCGHHHKKGTKLSIYLYSLSDDVLTRSTYADGNETTFCPDCGNLWEHCKCLEYNPDLCERCGEDPCVCGYTPCSTCGEAPCVCYLHPDYCNICGTIPCTCSGHD